MVVLFNNEQAEGDLVMKTNDRALQFGDGLFETIKVTNLSPQLLDYHISRVSTGARMLGFTLPTYLKEGQLRANIQNLMRKNAIHPNGTAKLIVWRKPEDQKAYFGGDTDANSLLLVKNYPDTPYIKRKVEFSEDVILHYWKLSQFKTISALPYVMAARERDQRGLDELVLVNGNGHVTECVASNIFWVKDETVFTPSLKTGCVAGVMRRFLLDQLIRENKAFKEIEATPKELLNADGVFTSNSHGIQPVTSIGEVTFNRSEDIVGTISEFTN